MAYKLKFVPPRGYKESSLVGPIATLVSGLSGTLLWSTSDSKGVLGSFVKKLAFKDLYLATGAKNDPRKAILRKPKTEDMKTLNILIGHCIDALNEYCGKVRTYVVPPNRYERGDFQQIFTDLEVVPIFLFCISLWFVEMFSKSPFLCLLRSQNLQLVH